MASHKWDQPTLTRQVSLATLTQRMKYSDVYGWFEQGPAPGNGDGESAPAKAAVKPNRR
jgi:hypothetical protein